MMVNGELPEGWEWKTIGDVTLPVEKVDPAQKPDREFTYLDIASIDNSVHKITEPKSYYGIDAPSRARQKVQANDVLFSTVRTYLEKIAQVPEIYDGQIASTGFSVLRTNELVLPKYLFYYSLTQNFLEPLNELQRGTSYPAVRDGDVRAQLIPLAPLPEQERIVSRIEELFSDLDAGVAALERVRVGLKRYKASVLKAAITGKLLNGKLETGEGELPEGWRWTKLPELGHLGRGKSKHRPRNADFLYGGEYPFIQTGDIRYADGVITSYTQTYSEAGLAQSKLWTKGTLCITIAANIADTAILGFDACFPDSVVGFIANEDVEVKFIEFYIRTIKDSLERFAPATAQKNINLDVLQKVPVPLPPLEEQRRIVAEVERRLSVVGEVESAVEAGLVRAGRLRQAVLRSAFEGKL